MRLATIITAHRTTPADRPRGGAGFARTPPVFMQPADVIEVTAEGVRTIRNRVVAEQGAAPQDWRWQPSGDHTTGL